ncbi:MAG: aminotransferase class V-fold PLP-dependent enzyme [Candidatus Dormibacteraeota bacterium]|nr:aminotransferase class V-fold PLP-dependent enzyme [Candidatus Dormibacteraeota bacterium]
MATAPTRAASPAALQLPLLAGHDLQVPLAGGELRPYVNLDYAASTPAMERVVDAVNAFLPWYASVHRGAGFPSQVSTRAHEAARHAIAGFVGARPSDHVVFVRNTTEALNLLASCLELAPGHVVLSTAVEHHANMLPWRRCAPVVALQPPPSPEALLEEVRAALEVSKRPVGVVSITGASNVTGEVFPIAEVARLAHEHGAKVVVDAAQLAPHRAIDMAASDVDCIALSGHKMYAPFGAGALVAPHAWLCDAEPMLAGGGAVSYVTLDDVSWAALPDRLEAGSPNVVGAVALATAATALQDVGLDRVAAHERELCAYLDERLRELPHVHPLRLWDGENVDRLGVCTFTVDGLDHALAAAVLSAEHGIGVRHGCFCAHPYIVHLLGIGDEESNRVRAALSRGEHHSIPGAVRASFGLGTTPEHIDRLVDALTEMTTQGPRLEYREDPETGDFTPVDDRRTFPAFDGLPDLDTTRTGVACGQF